MKFTALVISLLSVGLANAQPPPEASSSSTTNLRGGGDKNGNAMGDISGQDLPDLVPSGRQTQESMLSDWVLCSSSEECMTGCCASAYDDGRFKCTPMDGAFRPDVCVTQVGPPEDASFTTGSIGSSNSTAASITTSSFTTSATGTCGNGNRGNGVCANGQCCSQYGWCGTTAAHCGSGSTGGTCGNGSRGNGICANGQCCSQYGWCGTTSAHCGTGGGGGTPPPTGGLTITSPAITLTTRHVQAGINRKGDNVVVSQTIVDSLNRVTRTYPLYRQLAFVAHTIWESGSYQFKKELETANYGNYQDCDWNQAGDQLPNNGKQYYGRGYLQLSWCANYRAYGASRNFNNDPNLFYNQPELLETNEMYAMDSGAWFFETIVTDRSGQFGLTTRAINGALECFPGSTIARRRYEIFVAIATAVGMTGYSEGGCYN